MHWPAISNLANVGVTVGVFEVGLVQDQGALVPIYQPENRRDGSCTTGKDGPVTKRAYRLEKSAFAGAVVSYGSQVG